MFLVYAVTLAVRRPRSGMLGLLALFADAVYFLVLAGFGAGRLLWLISIFFLYLLTEALAFYGPVEVVVIAAVGIVFCAVLPNPAIRAAEPTVLVSGVLACGCAIQRRRHGAGMDTLREKLDEACKTADKARDVERQRIASDFHDGPLQNFISLQMRLEVLRKLLERDLEAGMEELRQLQMVAQSQVRDLRVFLHAMRPVDVDGADLVATARRTAEAFQKESGIPVAFIGNQHARRPAAGDHPRSLADDPRSASQRAETLRGHAGSGGDGKEREAAGDFGRRQRPRFHFRRGLFAGRTGIAAVGPEQPETARADLERRYALGIASRAAARV